MLWNCHELKWTRRDSYWLFGGKKETSPLLTYFTFCFNKFANLSLVAVLSSSVSSFSITPPACSVSFLSPILVSIFFSYTSPFLSLSPLLLLLPSILVSICCVWACLHGWRKGKERRGLLWIIHAATLVHQSSWDPPDACPPDSLLLSRLPLFTCTLCVFCCLYFLCVVLLNNLRIVAAFRVWGHPFLDKKNWCLHHLLFAFQPCIGQRLQYNCVSCHITPILHVYHMH